MITRTKRAALTFRHPFSLKGVDRRLAPGEYEVVSDEELIEELSFPVYRRISTLIFLPPHGSSSTEMVNIDPADLAAAQERDQVSSSVDAVAIKQHEQ